MSILPSTYPIQSAAPGQIYLDHSTGQTLVYNGSSWVTTSQPTTSLEQLASMNEYRRNKELREEEHRQRMEAARTIFPRGHSAIEDFDVMVEVARENLLNPLYEKVLGEFEAAQQALHRAAHKLASAVKLTDLEEVQSRAKTRRGSDHTTAINNVQAQMALHNARSGAYFAQAATSSSISAASASSAATSIQTAQSSTPVPGSTKTSWFNSLLNK